MPDEKHPALTLLPAERTDYLLLVACVAAADGIVADAEIARLAAWCRAFLLGPEETARVLAAAQRPEAAPVDAALARLRASPLRFTLVGDLLFLAHADGACADTEMGEIGRIAAACGVSRDQVEAISRYVDAIHQAGGDSHLSRKEIKKLGGDILSTLASTGVPVGAVAMGGAVLGGRSTAIASGLAALELGATASVGALAALGAGTWLGVRWLYRRHAGT